MEINKQKLDALRAIKNSNLVIDLIGQYVEKDPKVAFELLDELGQNLDSLGGIDLSKVEQLQGKNGTTPEFGKDYFTDEEVTGLEDFITENTSAIGEELAGQLQTALQNAQAQVTEAIASIPEIRDGKDVTKADIEAVLEKYKDELKGEHGSPDSALEIVEKIKKVKGKKRLAFKNVRGLPELKNRVINNTDNIDELDKEVKGIKNAVLTSTKGSGESGSSTFADLTDTDIDTPLNGQVATYNSTTSKWENTTPASGVTDHGLLTGLNDDDHTQYHTDSRADTWLGDKTTDDLSEGATNKYYPDADKNKLAGIESNATADQTDAEIKTAYENNSNTNAYTDADKTKVGHISVTQAVDLDQIESDTNTNNSKVSNATHTGEVTGSGALTVDPTAISNKTSKTITGTEEVLINDSGTLKKTTAQDIADLGGGGVGDFVLVKKTSNQNVNSTADTLVTFDTEVFDSGNNFSSNTYTVPSSGYYRIDTTIHIDNSDWSYTGVVKIKKNGITEHSESFLYGQNASGAGYQAKINTIRYFSSGDEIKIYTQNDDSTYDIVADTKRHTMLSIYKLA